MESEEKFKTLFMNANDAIYICDDMGNRIQEVNNIASEMLGYSRVELLHVPRISMLRNMLHCCLKGYRNSKGRKNQYTKQSMWTVPESIPVEISAG